MSKTNRRQYHTYPFVDRKFQFVTAFLFVLVGLVNALFFSLLFFVALRESFFGGAALMPAELLSDHLFGQQVNLWAKMMLFVAIPEAFLILLFALYFTHRVAGPIHGINMRLDQIAEGKIPEPIHSRRHYFLEQLNEKMNRSIGRLKTQRNAMEEALDQLRRGKSDEARQNLEDILKA